MEYVWEKHREAFESSLGTFVSVPNVLPFVRPSARITLQDACGAIARYLRSFTVDTGTEPIRSVTRR